MYCNYTRHEGLHIRHDREDPHELGKFSIHAHITAELFYFVSGRAVYHVEGSTYSLRPGDLLLIRPAEAHYIELDRTVPYERICLNFDTELFAALDPEMTLLRPLLDRELGKRNLYRLGNGSESRRYLDDMLGAKESRPEAVANLILLLRQLGKLFEQENAAPMQPDTLEYRLIHFINENLEKELTIRSLCDTFFLSRAQLCRQFKKVTGTSVGRYVAVKRLIKARELILQGSKPTEVYSRCGYQDYSTFYRAYLQYFHYSPINTSRALPEVEDRLIFSE